ncbi:SEC-C metal-binding domain-containing protein [Brevibacillus massiliensis]|uniref:SEC-C metal-binding domain-containing protein n=2 Tax=Brevibacillus massiliensis TaxID=1118054 RepID=UPI00031DB7AC|nr:SEC-C metal-binding domain-containing protein [Brevibacillus massiliensis]
MPTISKNQLCPCGSKKKYKLCCMPKSEGPQAGWRLKSPKLERAMEERRRDAKRMFGSLLVENVEEGFLPAIEGTRPSGLRTYTLFRLEQAIHELRQPNPRDRVLLALFSDLFWALTRKEKYYIKKAAEVPASQTRLLPPAVSDVLTPFEEQVAYDHCVEACLLDFAILPQGASLDYGALRITCEFVYRLLKAGIPEGTYFKAAILYIDTGDTLVDWKLFSASGRPEYVWIEYKAMDELENEYKKLQQELYAFSDESLRTIATAIDAENKLSEKSPELISYQFLAMSYFGVLEQELRTLIQQRERMPQSKRLMWREITVYLKKNPLPILSQYIPDFAKVMESLNGIRNRAAHGEFISYQMYQQVRSFVWTQRALEYLCWEKAGAVPPHARAAFDLTGLGVLPSEWTGSGSDEAVQLPQLREAIFENPQLAYDRARELYRQKDYAEAYRLAHCSAQSGHIPSYRLIAEMYEQGLGVAQSDFQAAKWLRKGAEAGDAHCQFWYGINLLHGDGVKKDARQAIYWMEKAAANGERKACTQLGSLYYSGKGVKPSLKKAFEWSLKAAEMGDAVSQYNIGMMYAKGQYVAQNHDEARRWLQAAADQQFERALVALNDFIGEKQDNR